MKPMISGRFLMAAALLASAASASTKGPGTVPGSDADIANKVRHEIVMYPHYTIFDDINYRVVNGSVELTGEVSQPYKKSDLTNIVKGIKGVTSVSNDVKVLPLSSMDDRLRLQVARAIYGNSLFLQYRNMALPPIHIIVDNGHVTLTGVVSTPMEKQVAGMRASSVGFSFGPVVNNLQVENPPAKKS